MKKLIAGMMLVPLVLLAEEPAREQIKPIDEQQARQYAGAVKACMRKADQGQLLMLQMRAAVMVAEVQGLCATGKRSTARSTAVRHVKSLERDPLVNQLRECSGLAEQEIPALAWTELENPSSANTDVCEIDLSAASQFF
jgi:hypothetical protein